MDDREELRRLIDVIEKSSGSGSLEQAVDDIKIFANTASFLTNKLGYYAARLNGSDAEEHKAWAAKLIHLKALCDSAIARQAEAVWRAPERMAL